MRKDRKKGSQDASGANISKCSSDMPASISLATPLPLTLKGRTTSPNQLSIAPLASEPSATRTPCAISKSWPPAEDAGPKCAGDQVVIEDDELVEGELAARANLQVCRQSRHEEKQIQKAKQGQSGLQPPSSNFGDVANGPITVSGVAGVGQGLKPDTALAKGITGWTQEACKRTKKPGKLKQAEAQPGGKVEATKVDDVRSHACAGVKIQAASGRKRKRHLSAHKQATPSPVIGISKVAAATQVAANAGDAKEHQHQQTSLGSRENFRTPIRATRKSPKTTVTPSAGQVTPMPHPTSKQKTTGTPRPATSTAPPPIPGPSSALLSGSSPPHQPNAITTPSPRIPGVANAQKSPATSSRRKASKELLKLQADLHPKLGEVGLYEVALHSQQRISRRARRSVDTGEGANGGGVKKKGREARGAGERVRGVHFLGKGGEGGDGACAPMRSSRPAKHEPGQGEDEAQAAAEEKLTGNASSTRKTHLLGCGVVSKDAGQGTKVEVPTKATEGNWQIQAKLSSTIDLQGKAQAAQLGVTTDVIEQRLVPASTMPSGRHDECLQEEVEAEDLPLAQYKALYLHQAQSVAPITSSGVTAPRPYHYPPAVVHTHASGFVPTSNAPLLPQKQSAESQKPTAPSAIHLGGQGAGSTAIVTLTRAPLLAGKAVESNSAAQARISAEDEEVIQWLLAQEDSEDESRELAAHVTLPSAAGVQIPPVRMSHDSTGALGGHGAKECEAHAPLLVGSKQGMGGVSGGLHGDVQKVDWDCSLSGGATGGDERGGHRLQAWGKDTPCAHMEVMRDQGEVGGHGDTKQMISGEGVVEHKSLPQGKLSAIDCVTKAAGMVTKSSCLGAANVTSMRAAGENQRVPGDNVGLNGPVSITSRHRLGASGHSHAEFVATSSAQKDGGHQSARKPQRPRVNKIRLGRSLQKRRNIPKPHLQESVGLMASSELPGGASVSPAWRVLISHTLVGAKQAACSTSSSTQGAAVKVPQHASGYDEAHDVLSELVDIEGEMDSASVSDQQAVISRAQQHPPSNLQALIRAKQGILDGGTNVQADLEVKAGPARKHTRQLRNTRLHDKESSFAALGSLGSASESTYAADRPRRRNNIYRAVPAGVPFSPELPRFDPLLFNAGVQQGPMPIVPTDVLARLPMQQLRGSSEPQASEERTRSSVDPRLEQRRVVRVKQVLVTDTTPAGVIEVDERQLKPQTLTASQVRELDAQKALDLAMKQKRRKLQELRRINLHKLAAQDKLLKGGADPQLRQLDANAPEVLEEKPEGNGTELGVDHTRATGAVDQKDVPPVSSTEGLQMAVKMQGDVRQGGSADNRHATQPGLQPVLPPPSHNQRRAFGQKLSGGGESSQLSRLLGGDQGEAAQAPTFSGFHGPDKVAPTKRPAEQPMTATAPTVQAPQVGSEAPVKVAHFEEARPPPPLVLLYAMRHALEDAELDGYQLSCSPTANCTALKPQWGAGLEGGDGVEESQERRAGQRWCKSWSMGGRFWVDQEALKPGCGVRKGGRPLGERLGVDFDGKDRSSGIQKSFGVANTGGVKASERMEKGWRRGLGKGTAAASRQRGRRASLKGVQGSGVAKGSELEEGEIRVTGTDRGDALADGGAHGRELDTVAQANLQVKSAVGGEEQTLGTNTCADQLGVVALHTLDAQKAMVALQQAYSIADTLEKSTQVHTGSPVAAQGAPSRPHSVLGNQATFWQQPHLGQGFLRKFGFGGCLGAGECLSEQAQVVASPRPVDRGVQSEPCASLGDGIDTWDEGDGAGLDQCQVDSATNYRAGVGQQELSVEEGELGGETGNVAALCAPALPRVTCNRVDVQVEAKDVHAAAVCGAQLNDVNLQAVDAASNERGLLGAQAAVRVSDWAPARCDGKVALQEDVPTRRQGADEAAREVTQQRFVPESAAAAPSDAGQQNARQMPSPSVSQRSAAMPKPAPTIGERPLPQSSSGGKRASKAGSRGWDGATLNTLFGGPKWCPGTMLHASNPPTPGSSPAPFLTLLAPQQPSNHGADRCVVSNGLLKTLLAELEVVERRLQQHVRTTCMPSQGGARRHVHNVACIASPPSCGQLQPAPCPPKQEGRHGVESAEEERGDVGLGGQGGYRSAVVGPHENFPKSAVIPSEQVDVEEAAGHVAVAETAEGRGSANEDVLAGVKFEMEEPGCIQVRIAISPGVKEAARRPPPTSSVCDAGGRHPSAAASQHSPDMNDTAFVNDGEDTHSSAKRRRKAPPAAHLARHQHVSVYMVAQPISGHDQAVGQSSQLAAQGAVDKQQAAGAGVGQQYQMSQRHTTQNEQSQAVAVSYGPMQGEGEAGGGGRGKHLGPVKRQPVDVNSDSTECNAEAGPYEVAGTPMLSCAEVCGALPAVLGGEQIDSLGVKNAPAALPNSMPTAPSSRSDMAQAEGAPSPLGQPTYHYQIATPPTQSQSGAAQQASSARQSNGHERVRQLGQTGAGDAEVSGDKYAHTHPHPASMGHPTALPPKQSPAACAQAPPSASKRSARGSILSSTNRNVFEQMLRQIISTELDAAALGSLKAKAAEVLSQVLQTGSAQRECTSTEVVQPLGDQLAALNAQGRSASKGVSNSPDGPVRGEEGRLHESKAHAELEAAGDKVPVLPVPGINGGESATCHGEGRHSLNEGGVIAAGGKALSGGGEVVADVAKSKGVELELPIQVQAQAELISSGCGPSAQAQSEPGMLQEHHKGAMSGQRACTSSDYTKLQGALPEASAAQPQQGPVPSLIGTLDQLHKSSSLGVGDLQLAPASGTGQREGADALEQVTHMVDQLAIRDLGQQACGYHPAAPNRASQDVVGNREQHTSTGVDQIKSHNSMDVNTRRELDGSEKAKRSCVDPQSALQAVAARPPDVSTAHVSTEHVSTEHVSTAHVSTAHVAQAAVASEVEPGGQNTGTFQLAQAPAHSLADAPAPSNVKSVCDHSYECGPSANVRSDDVGACREVEQANVLPLRATNTLSNLHPAIQPQVSEQNCDSQSQQPQPSAARPEPRDRETRPVTQLHLQAPCAPSGAPPGRIAAQQPGLALPAMPDQDDADGGQPSPHTSFKQVAPQRMSSDTSLGDGHEGGVPDTGTSDEGAEVDAAGASAEVSFGGTQLLSMPALSTGAQSPSPSPSISHPPTAGPREMAHGALADPTFDFEQRGAAGFVDGDAQAPHLTSAPGVKQMSVQADEGENCVHDLTVADAGLTGQVHLHGKHVSGREEPGSIHRKGISAASKHSEAQFAEATTFYGSFGGQPIYARKGTKPRASALVHAPANSPDALAYLSTRKHHKSNDTPTGAILDKPSAPMPACHFTLQAQKCVPDSRRAERKQAPRNLLDDLESQQPTVEVRCHTLQGVGHATAPLNQPAIPKSRTLDDTQLSAPPLERQAAPAIHIQETPALSPTTPQPTPQSPQTLPTLDPCPLTSRQSPSHSPNVPGHPAPAMRVVQPDALADLVPSTQPLTLSEAIHFKRAKQLLDLHQNQPAVFVIPLGKAPGSGVVKGQGDLKGGGRNPAPKQFAPPRDDMLLCKAAMEQLSEQRKRAGGCPSKQELLEWGDNSAVQKERPEGGQEGGKKVSQAPPSAKGQAEGEGAALDKVSGGADTAKQVPQPEGADIRTPQMLPNTEAHADSPIPPAMNTARSPPNPSEQRVQHPQKAPIRMLDGANKNYTPTLPPPTSVTIVPPNNRGPTRHLNLNNNHPPPGWQPNIAPPPWGWAPVGNSQWMYRQAATHWRGAPPGSVPRPAGQRAEGWAWGPCRPGEVPGSIAAQAAVGGQVLKVAGREDGQMVEAEGPGSPLSPELQHEVPQGEPALSTTPARMLSGQGVSGSRGVQGAGSGLGRLGPGAGEPTTRLTPAKRTVGVVLEDLQARFGYKPLPCSEDQWEVEDKVTDVGAAALVKGVVDALKLPSSWDHTQRSYASGCCVPLLTNIHGERFDKRIEPARIARKFVEALSPGERGWEGKLASTREEMRRRLFSMYRVFQQRDRYTQAGRYFTPKGRLEWVVKQLWPYVKDGDCLVDFSAGENTLVQCALKWVEEERKAPQGRQIHLRAVGFDINAGRNMDNFVLKSWFKHTPTPRKHFPLPAMDGRPPTSFPGSKLIIGLNPPYGSNGTQAQDFVNHAVEFEPRLIALIVPPQVTIKNKEGHQGQDLYRQLLLETEQFRDKAFFQPGTGVSAWNRKDPEFKVFVHRDFAEEAEQIKQRTQRETDRNMEEIKHAIRLKQEKQQRRILKKRRKC